MTDRKNQWLIQMKKSSRTKKKALGTTQEKEDKEEEVSFLTYTVAETDTDEEE